MLEAKLNIETREIHLDKVVQGLLPLGDGQQQALVIPESDPMYAVLKRNNYWLDREPDDVAGFMDTHLKLYAESRALDEKQKRYGKHVFV